MSGDSVAAVFIESIQGEGGVFPADPGFLKELRALCTERKALLMLDEARFRRLLRRSEAMRNSVKMSANKRMIDPAVLDLDEPVGSSEQRPNS